jgi:hypothetical protein
MDTRRLSNGRHVPQTPEPIGDGIELPDAGIDPVNIGDIKRNGNDIKAKDGSGVFNLRANATLGVVILTIDGGLVYANNGELTLKEVA